MMAAPRIPNGPIQADPGGYLPRPILRSLLADALARVELGAWDRRILDWLAGWDASTVLPIVSLIVRARRAEATQVAADLAGLTPRSHQPSGPRLPAREAPEHDVNPICGHRLRARCDGCGTCTVCDGCYCGEA